MKKLFITLLLISLLIPAFADDTTADSVTKDYSDVKEVLTKLVDATEDFVSGIEKAKNPKQMIKIIEKYTKDVEKIKPVLSEMPEKYPELNDPDKMPEELEEVFNKIQETFASERYQNADKKLSEYAENNEKVKEAYDELTKKFSE